MTSPRRDGGHTDAAQEASQPPGLLAHSPGVAEHQPEHRPEPQVVTEGADVSQQLLTVLTLAAGAGCLITLFVAAHLSWIEKQRRRAWKPDRPEGASPEGISIEGEGGCGGFEATA